MLTHAGSVGEMVRTYYNIMLYLLQLYSQGHHVSDAMDVSILALHSIFVAFVEEQGRHAVC